MPRISKNLSRIHNLHASGDFGFGIVTYQANGKLGPRRQGHYQLVVVHQGSLRVRVNGEFFAVIPGEGILLQPGNEEFFQFSEATETTHSWCQISSAVLPAAFAFSPSLFNRPAECSPWLLELMKTGWELNAGSPTVEWNKRMIAAICAAMWEFGRVLAGPIENARPIPEALIKAARMIEEKLAEPLRLDELARHAGVSKGHFILLAREHWKVTPIEYLWQQRVEKSAELLRETGLGIAEVAYRTGFENPFHFSRRFKQRFGQHPRAWRESQWRS